MFSISLKKNTNHGSVCSLLLTLQSILYTVKGWLPICHSLKLHICPAGKFQERKSKYISIFKMEDIDKITQKRLEALYLLSSICKENISSIIIICINIDTIYS
jgi:hypothetical protein